jgi:hypothetical protein
MILLFLLFLLFRLVQHVHEVAGHRRLDVFGDEVAVDLRGASEDRMDPSFGDRSMEATPSLRWVRSTS